MTPESEDWHNIACSLRIALEKRIPDVAVMTPTELKDFVSALMWAETLSETTVCRDERIEAKQRTLQINGCSD